MAKSKPLCSTDFDENTEARFWSKVDRRGPDECWEWQAHLDDSGYGRAHIGHKQPVSREQRTHRISWCLDHPRQSTGDSLVLHSCDNPPCCNPNHLSLGTFAENIRQMVERGGHARGDAHPQVRFSDKEVVDAVAAHWDGESQRSVAKRLGVSRTTIKDAARGMKRKDAYMEALLCVNT